MNSICFCLKKKKTEGNPFNGLRKKKNLGGFKIFLLCYMFVEYNKNFLTYYLYNILSTENKVVLRIIGQMIKFFDG